MNDASGVTLTAPTAAPRSPIATAVAAARTATFRFRFGHFLHEFVEGLFHVDSKFWRTLRTLLTRPGLLTEQYLGGKRHVVLAAVSQLSRHLDRVLRPRVDLRARRRRE